MEPARAAGPGSRDRIPPALDRHGRPRCRHPRAASRGAHGGLQAGPPAGRAAARRRVRAPEVLRGAVTLRSGHDLENTVVVAMATVRVVQVAVDEIVHVVAVRHRRMPAAGTVHVAGVVPATAVLRGASRWIPVRHLHAMLVHVVPVRVMQVPVMQVVDMVAMADSHMAAAGAVHMVMVVVVRLVAVHRRGPFGPGWVLGTCSWRSLAWSMAFATRSITCWSARS